MQNWAHIPYDQIFINYVLGGRYPHPVGDFLRTDKESFREGGTVVTGMRDFLGTSQWQIGVATRKETTKNGEKVF